MAVQDVQVNIACREGCAFCCYIPIVCSEGEAKTALSWVSDRAAVETRIVKANGYDFTPCVFLDLKAKHCTVYEARPYACRGYTSMSQVACETAHRRRDANADIPADGGNYWYWWQEADALPGKKRPLVAWLKEMVQCPSR